MQITGRVAMIPSTASAQIKQTTSSSRHSPSLYTMSLKKKKHVPSASSPTPTTRTSPVFTGTLSWLTSTPVTQMMI